MLWDGMYIGGLKSSLEDGDGVILSCDIAEILGSTTNCQYSESKPFE